MLSVAFICISMIIVIVSALTFMVDTTKINSLLQFGAILLVGGSGFVRLVQHIYNSSNKGNRWSISELYTFMNGTSLNDMFTEEE